MTEFQKSQMENTHKVLEGIKGTVGGVLDVFSTLTSGVMGGLRCRFDRCNGQG